MNLFIVVTFLKTLYNRAYSRFYPKLIRLCRMIVELHEEEGYQKIVDNWSEDPDVQSAYEFYELIDSIEED